MKATDRYIFNLNLGQIQVHSIIRGPIAQVLQYSKDLELFIYLYLVIIKISHQKDFFIISVYWVYPHLVFQDLMPITFNIYLAHSNFIYL